MGSTDKEVYNEKICKFCKNQDNCSKNKFNVFVFNDKVSMRCSEYKYINEVEGM